jgi:hypothetical protein
MCKFLGAARLRREEVRLNSSEGDYADHTSTEYTGKIYIRRRFGVVKAVMPRMITGQ